MKRKIGTIFSYLIHHRRILLPQTYEVWSNHLATPYLNLKDFDFVGLTHPGAAKWTSAHEC
jgi:hypothetical protein